MAALTRSLAGTASAAGWGDDPTIAHASRLGAAVPASTPLDEVLELFAWARRTRATSQRLRCDANELKEAAIEIRGSVRLRSA